MADFDPRKVTRFGNAFIRASDYNELLKLYRQEQVKSAVAAFKETSDSAVADEQARDIQRLQAELTAANQRIHLLEQAGWELILAPDQIARAAAQIRMGTIIGKQ